MTNKLRPAILLLLYFLFLQYVYGQKQVNVAGYLSQRFLKYCESVPREEIFIHSDREAYIAGEDLWFNIYLIDRQSYRPSGSSRIAYFELLNPENRPVVQKRILIDKGFGPGQIVLPDTLSSGTYTIRAYTSWMENFLPENCFMKDIRIFNAFSTKTFIGKVNSGYLSGRGNDAGPIAEINVVGLNLKVDNLKPDILEIFVNADENWRSQNSDLFYLFIQTHGIIDHVSSEKILEENTKITIPKKLLNAGINQITVFDSKGQPVCERFIYTPDNKEQFLALQPIDSMNIRSKVTLDIDLGNELFPTLNTTNLSISVAPETDNPGEMDLNDYMVFGSEYGLLPLKTINGRKINEIPPEEMDSFLSKVKSNWINWKTILSDNPPSFKYRVEKEDHYLSGALLNSDQQPAHPDEYLLMSTPGKEAVFQYAKTNKEGNFNFNIHIDEGLKDFVIQPDGIIKNQTIKIESSFSEQYLPSEKSMDSINKPILSFISKWIVSYQVRKIYESSSAGDTVAPFTQQSKPKRFYGTPDTRLIMADYIKLPVMQEVFFELIPGAFLKNKKSVYEISVTDPVDNIPYEAAPGLLIDGVIIKDPSMIANLDPEIVEKIDVVREKYFVGDYLFYGLVNVITKTGDFSCVTLPGNAVRLPYRVIEPVVTFASPDYSTAEMKNSRLPDFRNTLYWNPSIRPDKDGKARIEFWTSDIASECEVKIQGITGNGKIISLKKTIKIY